MKNNKKTNKKGGFYIALCSCAVVVATVSYVSDLLGKDNKVSNEPKSIALESNDPEPEKITEKENAGAEHDVIILEPEIEPEPEPETATTAVHEEVNEFLPVLPAPGKIIAEFSNQTPIFHERLGDWRTHNGIDIEAAVGDDVYVCETGVVEKIYKNNLGGCILVDHQNGYKSLYANLGQIDLVAVGDELHTGETIGRVGEASLGDITAAPHIHFEMYYNGKAIDPLEKVAVE